MEILRNKYYIVPKILKPLYETDEGSYIMIYDFHLKEAIRRRQAMLITTNWRGREIQKVCLPKAWRKVAQKIEKVFNYPDRPMVLYGSLIPAPKVKTEEDRLKELSLSGVFG
jgi:hypothetical protein